MKKVLGLDISSSTIGWAVIEFDEKQILLSEYGHIKPPKSSKGSLAARVSYAYDEMIDFLRDKSPEIVAIEAYANKFPAGRSTARTIIVLSVFNEVMAMASIKGLDHEPKRYAVMTVRSCMSGLAGHKISSKEECFEFIQKYFPAFKIRLNRVGKIAKECYDEADAIAVAATCVIKERHGG
jgi:Holliday junction resolvasome RuvABC endonuclease subunit